MFTKDEIIEWFVAFYVFMISRYVFGNIFISFSLAVISFFSVLMYFSEKERSTIHSEGQGIKIPSFESEFLPNTLLQESNPALYVTTGFLILSTIEDDVSVATIRLQNQFNIFYSYSQIGAVYLFFNKFEITQSWSNLSEEKQGYILQQSRKHLDNFQKVLFEVVPGLKQRFLTIKELKEELALAHLDQILLNFDYSTDPENTPKDLNNDEDSYSVQDIQESHEIIPELTSN